MKPFVVVRIVAASLIGLGCSDAPTGTGLPAAREPPVPHPLPVLPQLLVSNPIAAPAGTTAGAAAREVAYVSLPAGTLPDMILVQIRNVITGASSPAVELTEGGFDPVPVAAALGHKLEVTFFGSDGSPSVFQALVEGRKAPRVVRLAPAADGTDVEAGIRPTVIFSEPVTPVTLTAGVRLLTGGREVSGSVLVPDGTPWIAEFVPAAALEQGSTYELQITQAVRDLDGDALAAPITATFQTLDPRAPGQGRLAFSHWNYSDLKFHVFTMKPDGKGLSRLSPGRDPSWSPDGSRIAFWRWSYAGEGATGIYVMNADGSDVTQVTPDGYMPTWSPDGRRLAFGCGGICVVSIDGTGRSVLAHQELGRWGNDFCAEDTHPAWSPDGTTIAFTRWPPVGFAPCPPYGVIMSFPLDFWPELWLVDADGTNPRELRTADGESLAHAAFPAWSPDGKRIAFYGAHYGTSGIRVINRDGTGLYNVWHRDQETPENYGGPAWSPDGTRIVVPELYPDAGNPAGRFRIFRADGSAVDRVVNAPFPRAFTWVVWQWSSR